MHEQVAKSLVYAWSKYMYECTPFGYVNLWILTNTEGIWNVTIPILLCIPMHSNTLGDVVGSEMTLWLKLGSKLTWEPVNPKMDMRGPCPQTTSNGAIVAP